MVQCPTGSLYIVARKPSHPLMKSIPRCEIILNCLCLLEANCEALNERKRPTGNTVVARLQEVLCEKDKSSELILILRCPWITGALSLTKSRFSKSIRSARDSAPGIGSWRK